MLSLAEKSTRPDLKTPENKLMTSYVIPCLSPNLRVEQTAVIVGKVPEPTSSENRLALEKKPLCTPVGPLLTAFSLAPPQGLVLGSLSSPEFPPCQSPRILLATLTLCWLPKQNGGFASLTGGIETEVSGA